MIVVFTVVKAYEFELNKLSNIRRRWIDHTNNVVISLILPVYEEEIRKDLNIIEYDRSVVICLNVVCRNITHEVHFLDTLETVSRLI